MVRAVFTAATRTATSSSSFTIRRYQKTVASNKWQGSRIFFLLLETCHLLLFLNPIRRRRHHLRHQPHGLPDGLGQGGGAGFDRNGGMFAFVLAHLIENRPALFIGRRQLFEVPIQVFYDLALGFGDKSQTPLFTRQSGCRADSKGACVPERIEITRVRAELAEALGSPGKVVVLLGRGLFHLVAHVG